jgi:23S rRNA (adenine2503-C2)-methyltransferase
VLKEPISVVQIGDQGQVLDPRRELLDFDREELEAELQNNLQLQSYRARQVVRWLYKFRNYEISSWSDISKEVRAGLEEHYKIFRPNPESVQQSIDGTRKYLFRLPDNSLIESVLIRQPKRYTLCVSSQVGCAIGCAFCRTGKMGLTRHLSTSEIIGQVLAVQDDIQRLQDADLSNAPDQFQNIVFMGMGEPFHNIKNVTRAVKLLNDPLGFAFSGRKITVSTSGLVPAIEEFGNSLAKANLAISLNATTNEVRDYLIPINKKWPLEKLLDTLKKYPLKKGRRITIEYVMLKGVNDSKDDLKRLPNLLHGIPSKVNLIPYNQNTGLGFEPPSNDVVFRWQKSLVDLGINSTIRWSKGVDIDAACGQLATISKKEKKVREIRE